MRGALLRSSNDSRYCLQRATSLRVSTRAGLRAPWLEPAVRREHRWIWQETISIVIEGQRWLSWLNAWNMFEECHIITSFYIIWHHMTSCFKLPFLFHLCRIRFFRFFFARSFQPGFQMFRIFFSVNWDTMKCCRLSVPELIGSCSCCWSQPSGPSPPLRRCSCLGQLRPFDKKKSEESVVSVVGWGYCNWEVTDKLFMILSWDCHDTDGCVNDATWYATWYNNPSALETCDTETPVFFLSIPQPRILSLIRVCQCLGRWHYGSLFFCSGILQFWPQRLCIWGSSQTCPPKCLASNCGFGRVWPIFQCHGRWSPIRS